MTEREAEDQLSDGEVVVALQGALAYVKRVRDECLAAGIPVALGREECASKGCSPKLQLLVRREDIPRFAGLVQRDWQDMVAREGTGVEVRLVAGKGAAEAEDGEPPCPCCGTAAPLVDGACSDCGLHLE